MIHIRTATSLDSEDIREVHLRAFPEAENQKVSMLAVDLLSEETDPETISLVAEANGEVVGHIAFSPVTMANNNSRVGYILAPLGVKPAYQKQGIGSKLVESGLERLSKTGVNIVFVYGDPEFYGKFGFNRDTASGYSPPCKLQYPFGWQAVSLDGDVSANSAVKISCVASLNDAELW